jgi:hypothetical protein
LQQYYFHPEARSGAPGPGYFVDMVVNPRSTPPPPQQKTDEFNQRGNSLSYASNVYVGANNS